MMQGAAPVGESWITGLAATCGGDATALLPILHEAQERFAHIPRAVMQQIARTLSLPLAQVEAVVEFYHFFSSQPRGRYDILLSSCVIDRMRGGDESARLLCERLRVTPGGRRADGVVSVRHTSCTGMCDQGPALLVNGHAIAGLERERVEQVASLIERQIPLREWPRGLFRIAGNIRRSGPLLSGEIPPGAALQRALSLGRKGLLERLERSGLRGRGGAGFPTALKWRACREAPGEHYVVCNADEGEPGTFKDRELLRRHAHAVFEGMTLAAWVIGARRGFLYLRGEYRFLLQHLEQVLAERRGMGLLGERIGGGRDFCFDIAIRLGAGAYICGEESALLESLQGNLPRPRNRPPYPVTHGLFGQPTVVNNVESFAAAAHIALNGDRWLTARGTEHSRGSKLLSISGDCARPGIYEFAFGTPLEEILDACGARDLLGVQMGGPSGNWITPAEFQRSLAFEDLSSAGALMVFGRERDLLEIVHGFSRFFAHESCGFCTPCRVGTGLQARLVEKLRLGRGCDRDLERLRSLGELMSATSHCGLGQSAPNPVLTTLEKELQRYRERLVSNATTPDFDPGQELQATRSPA